VVASHPDIVLMDIDMPGEDGISTTRRLKSEFPDVTVVMLTVHDATDKLLEASNWSARPSPAGFDSAQQAASGSPISNGTSIRRWWSQPHRAGPRWPRSPAVDSGSPCGGTTPPERRTRTTATGSST